MLHEILLSLTGHPSPLLQAPTSFPYDHNPTPDPKTLLTPSERALLASLSRLSTLHVRVAAAAAEIAASHPSTICRAVAHAVDAVHLAAFRRKVLDVEAKILRRDAELVGAYEIVPLTAVVGEFEGWSRRMEWLWEGVVGFIGSEDGGRRKGEVCSGAKIIDRLRGEMRTGYRDVEEAAESLVAVAEGAWLKQVSAWVLYGRLPGYGEGDFFVQRSGDGEDYVCKSDLLPSFVTPSTASSMLFIGKSLNQIRARSGSGLGSMGNNHLSSQLQRLSKLSYPLDSATFARTITDIRLFLSRTILQKLLPLTKVTELLHLLRDVFLLRRGEFAMALTQQADHKVRSRWRRAEHLAHEKSSHQISQVAVKEGEVAAVLSRTWQALGSMQGQHSDEDAGLEFARGLLRLKLLNSNAPPPDLPGFDIAPTPFRNLHFGIPVVVTLSVPSPLDLFLSPTDSQVYTAINAYLLSIRRAHIRLTDMWKITALRRHHPPPLRPPHSTTPHGTERNRLLRARQTERGNVMRSAWATASAAIFFLAETEAYLQGEVVAGLTDDFHRWLVGGPAPSAHDKKPPEVSSAMDIDPTSEDEDMDIWLATGASTDSLPNPISPSKDFHRPHDPQTITTAHRLYLATLTRALLLSSPTFTQPLYELLISADGLVGLVHRLQDIWAAMDLEADAGVVDAFVDLEKDERGTRTALERAEAKVKAGVESVVGVLRGLEGDHLELDGKLGGEGEWGVGMGREEGAYVPRRVGGVERLLVKLDFGSWFGEGNRSSGDRDGA